jgi:hypothetical protein
MSGYRVANLSIATVMVVFLTTIGIYLWNGLSPADLGAMPEWQATGAPEPVRSANPNREALRGTRVAIWEDTSSARYLEPGRYEAGIGAWRQLLANAGVREVDESGADVLVLSSALCMGADEIGRLRRHLEGGGGVVTTGRMGTRGGSCELRETSVLDALLGERGGISPPTPDASGLYLLVTGESALGAALPAGARIELRPGAQLAFRGSDADLPYSTHARERTAHGDPAGAAVRALVGPGRLVALGFEPQDAADETSAALLGEILGNAVGWAAGRPLVRLASWPEGYRSAAVFAQDVEHEFDNAVGAIEILERAGIAGTYFVVGDLAARSRRTLRRIVEAGELASHTTDHVAIGGRPAEDQFQRLSEAQLQLRSLAGFPVVGLRPPEEKLDGATLAAWAAAGGTYLFGPPMQTGVPELAVIDGRTLVVMGRSADDDYQLYHADGERDLRKMADLYLTQLETVWGYGGLFTFSYHSQILARPDLLPVLDAVARRAAQDPTIWTARADEIAEWWTARGTLVVEIDPDGASATIRNGGAEPVEPPPLLASLPGGEERTIALPALAPGEIHRVVF